MNFNNVDNKFTAAVILAALIISRPEAYFEVTQTETTPDWTRIKNAYDEAQKMINNKSNNEN